METRPVLDDQERADEAIATYSEGAARLSRKRLLLTAATGAGGALAAALVVPALSLGPERVEASCRRAPGVAGGASSTSTAARSVPSTSASARFRTALPAGMPSKEQLASRDRRRPDSRRRARSARRARVAGRPTGILAFSKICPHAGCAISLFRYPSFDDTSPGPALICPCHYSTFYVADGGTRTFGPAGTLAAAVAARDRRRRLPRRRWRLLGPHRPVLVEGARVIKRGVRFLESRVGSSGLVKKTLDYVFPDHWSFLLGEIALYCFLVLVATGIYLTFFFEPSYAHVVYHGAYAPLRGTTMTEAYRSTLDLSYRVEGRAADPADAPLGSERLHRRDRACTCCASSSRARSASRATSTPGSGRRCSPSRSSRATPGYSLPDDLLSGMGLAIGYSVALSVPVIGAWLATLDLGRRSSRAATAFSRASSSRTS